jgi:hypothetical protein
MHADEAGMTMNHDNDQDAAQSSHFENPENWVDAETYADRHANLVKSADAVRAMARNRQKSGLAKFDAVRIIGRRLVIHDLRFTQFLLRQAAKASRYSRSTSTVSRARSA